MMPALDTAITALITDIATHTEQLSLTSKLCSSQALGSGEQDDGEQGV